MRLKSLFLNCIKFEKAPDDHVYEDAYEYSINDGSRRNIVEGCRVYPRSTSIYGAFALSDLLMELEESRPIPAVNAQALFNLDQLDAVSEERVFGAIEWFNRSCLENVTADIALVSLAVAFETLLGIRRNANGQKRSKSNAIRYRLLSSMESFLGDLPSLSEWLEQFYNARSRILHEGNWSQLRFSVVQNDSQSEKQQNEYGYLIHYGWLIFRICLNSFWAGRLQVALVNLKSKFFHNQERLEHILQVLTAKDVDAFNALTAIVEDVKVLYRYPATHFRSIRFETLCDVAMRLRDRLLELTDEITQSQRDDLENLLTDTQTPSSEEVQAIIEHVTILMRSANELPDDKVRQPAIKQLTGSPPPKLEEIKNHVQQILDDSRNENISKELGLRLKNVITLIDYCVYRTKLKPFTVLAKHGDFITKHRLFSLIEGFASYIVSVTNENELNTSLYIAKANIQPLKHTE